MRKRGRAMFMKAFAPRKRTAALLALALSAALACTALAGCDDEPSPLTPEDGESYGIAGTDAQVSGLRDRFVNVKDAKSATVMVFMCGSDLESQTGAASSDIAEICKADLGSNVNVVLETGGADDWYTDGIDAKTRQRWHVADGELKLDQDAGAGTMLSTDEVTGFIDWARASYPADRYMLVFWDHGAGTIGGFGYDERYPKDDALSLADLRKAIQASGQAFDLVGFDACLMGSIETAYALEPCADYLLASEEIEPCDGWAWTEFLNALGKKPNASTVSLGKVAVNAFTQHYFDEGTDNVTLSLVDLREVPHVYEELGDFLQSAQQSIAADNARFSEMSHARTKARSYAQGDYDMVDLADLISKTDFDGKKELLEAVQSCVKYRSLTSLDGSNGLALYFPYSAVSSYSDTRAVLSDLGYVEPTEFYDYFLSVMGNSNGGSETGGSGGFLESLGGSDDGSTAQDEADSYADESFSGEDWFEAITDFLYSDTPDELELTQTDDGYVVDMDDDLWDTMGSFAITVLQKQDGGYLMMGRDNLYDVTADEDILVEYDDTWACLNGTPVSFFSDEPTENDNGDYVYSGSIPALLNGKSRIDIIVTWDPTDEQGHVGDAHVEGYRLRESASQSYSRVFDFEKGDRIVPIFDWYDGDGELADTVKGDRIVVDDPAKLEFSYEEYEHEPALFWGTMTTIYGDQIDTETVTQK